MSNKRIYSCSFEVRDSELDSQGIVNNAFYFVYMEHCRHQHLKILGFDFYEIQQQGIDLILRDCAIQFKKALSSGDHFTVHSQFELKNRYRIHVYQEIFKDGMSIATGTFTVTGVNRHTGKLELPASLLSVLTP